MNFPVETRDVSPFVQKRILQFGRRLSAGEGGGGRGGGGGSGWVSAADRFSAGFPDSVGGSFGPGGVFTTDALDDMMTRGRFLVPSILAGTAGGIVYCVPRKLTPSPALLLAALLYCGGQVEQKAQEVKL